MVTDHVTCEQFRRAVRTLHLSRDVMNSIAEDTHDKHGPVTEDVRKAMKHLGSLSMRPIEEYEDSFELKLLVLAFDNVAAAWNEWVEQFDATGENPDGMDEMYTAMSAMTVVMNEGWKVVFVDPHLESTRNVGPRQIAMMMRWESAGGIPDTHRVERELSKPGSEWKYTDKHQDQQDREDAVNARWLDRFEQQRLSAVVAAAPPEEKVPPESLEQLILGKCNVRQIQAIYPNIGVEEICRVANELDVTLPDQADQASWRRLRVTEKAIQLEADQTERTRLARNLRREVKPLDELETMEEKVYYLWRSGRAADGTPTQTSGIPIYSAGEIAAALKDNYELLTVQKIGAMVREFKRADGEIEAEEKKKKAKKKLAKKPKVAETA